MQDLSRWVLSTLIGLAALLCAAPGQAWTEKRVASSSTVIELERDGSAIVRYQLSLDVRGAPLKSWSLSGVDVDAVPLPDATLTRMQGGVATSLPLPVKLTASAGTLSLEVPLRNGFKGRSFRLEFGYRSNLLARGLLRHVAGAPRSELAWAGPRFDDGVDSVSVLVRTRGAELAPEIPPDGDELGNYGIISSTLRRSEATDELELVRTHIARQEAITWRVSLDRELFEPARTTGSAAPAAEEPPAAPASAQVASAQSVDFRTRLPWLIGASALYAALIWLKARGVERACALRGAVARSWLGAPGWVRAMGGGWCALGALLAVFTEASPVWSAALLLGAMACAAQRAPSVRWEPLGPGEWRHLDVLAFTPVPAPALPGAWLDAGRWPGFALLLLTLAANVWWASALFTSSPYFGSSSLFASSALLPLFCTGRAAELPRDVLADSRRFLGRFVRLTRRDPDLQLTPMGRFSSSTGALEELRLSIAPKNGRPGLLGLELGLEQRGNLNGFRSAPVLVVRAADGSACQRALPRHFMWTRGRSAEERALLVRPKLGTPALTQTLLYELLSLLCNHESAASAARSRAARSSGKGLSTANAGTRSSPAHAT